MTNSQPYLTSEPGRRVSLRRFMLHAPALVALMLYWPTPRALYPVWFELPADALLGALTDGRLRITMTPSGPVDTEVEAGAGSDGSGGWTLGMDMVRLGWWPTAGDLALLLATPMSAPRRLRSAALGVAILQAVTLLRLGVAIGYAAYATELDPAGDAVQGWVPLLMRGGVMSLTGSLTSVALVALLWVWQARPREALATGGDPA